MDIRILKYFIAVAEEGNITKAATRLHVSQPALSTQLAALEEELGQILLVRGARGIVLTDKGIALKRRADDLVELAQRIEDEIKAKDSTALSGTISIGAGETPAFSYIANAAADISRRNPRVNFMISSGNGEDMIDRLREGTLDLGVMVGPGRYDGLDYLTLPYTHEWGLVVRKDSALASLESISPSDAQDIPLISSRQSMVREFIAGWFRRNLRRLHIIGTFNLPYNAMMMVASGVAGAICIDGIIPQCLDDVVVFKPFSPKLKSDVYLAWRKNSALSPLAKAFIDSISRQIEETAE